MRLLCEPQVAAPVECPYLPDRVFVQDYFFADDLDEHEFGVLMKSGWRRFGRFFFRPDCPGCRQCIPIRIDVQRLTPAPRQRRVIRRGTAVRMEAVEPAPTEEAWRVYRAHSEGQFGRQVQKADFEHSFYERAVPSLQTEYRIDGSLVALGFLDIGEDGMSSVYFSFDPAWKRYSLGTLSVFREAELVRSTGRRWYYLGYWVPGSARMDYKARFAPHQIRDWTSGRWNDSDQASDADE